MAKTNECWGIEVGANAIKAMRLARDGNEARLLEYDVVPFKQVLTTPDLNADEAIQLGLDQFMGRHDLTNSSIMVSIPGHMAFARFAKLPPVEPKKIPDIVKFEAVQQIPFPIDQVEWDYQVFQQEDSPDVEVGIFAITKDRITQFLSNYRGVGMNVDGLTLSPLAVYNAMAYDMQLSDASPGTIFIDIGTTATDVIIVEQGQIWLRTLPIGGNNFTDALVRQFKLSFPKAEKLKREAGTSKYARQIFQAMRPVFADLVQEMQRSLGYYQSLNRDAQLETLIGVGSTFRLPGLMKFLKQQLQMEVNRPTGFGRIGLEGRHAAEFAENSLNLSTAYGLALQGIGLDAVGANLLPAHIVKQRLWRAKQPWIGVAAALMIAASGVAAAKLWHDRGQYRSGVTKSDQFVQPVLGKAQGFKSNWDQNVTGADPRQRIENLRRVLDYRDIWPKVLHDVSLAAQAMAPQEVTLTADYDEIAKIPRNQRRRMYIDQLSTTYVPPQAVGGVKPAPGQTDWWSNFDRNAPASARVRPMSAQEQAAQAKRNAAAAPAGKTPPAATHTGTPAATPAAVKATPPTFVIRIKGTTPFRDAANLLSNNFVKWLQTNARRNDRPYDIIVGSLPLTQLRRVGDAPAEPGRTGAQSGQTNEPKSNFNFTVPTPAPKVTKADAAKSPAEDPAALLPVRPLKDEPRNDDWEFEIEWSIRVVPRDFARQAEDTATPPSPADQPPPANGTTPRAQSNTTSPAASTENPS